MAKVYGIEEEANEVPTLKRGISFINDSFNKQKDKFKNEMKQAYQIEVLRSKFIWMIFY